MVRVYRKTLLGNDVDIGQGRIVLNGFPVVRESCTAALPLFSAQVCCGHGRPSQLLLSSCFKISMNSLTR